MKKLIAVLIIILFSYSLGFTAGPNDVLNFPLVLDKGKYELEVPKSDQWRIFNNDSWDKVQLQFAEKKLALEHQTLICEQDKKYIQEIANANAEYDRNVCNIKLDAANTQIDDLKKRDTSEFLGLSKFTWGYIMGIATVILSAYVTDKTLNHN